MTLQPFKLERYFAEFEFTAKHLLSSSDCEPLMLTELLSWADEESLNLWNGLRLSYTESQGLPLLREEIAQLYEGISPEQILVAGPQEGIYLCMQSLLKAGDEIVCIFPAYQSLFEIAKSKGCKLKLWHPDRNNTFSISDLRGLLTDSTRMLVINFPHNPTGALISQEEFDEIIELVRENNILLFSDEMYRYLEYDAARRLPSACEIYENAISLCGMSKSFSLPGLRLGWLVLPKNFISLLNSYKDYTSICPPAPSEILALIALRNKSAIVKRNLNIISRNISLLENFSERNPHFIRWFPPIGGSVAFPAITVKKEIEGFTRCLTRKTGVMLLPSSVYDYEHPHVRFGLGRKNIQLGLHLLEEFIR